MQNHPFPWEFFPELTEERLTIIAEELLRIQDITHELLSSPYDDNYTRGGCTFGRQRQALLQMCVRKTYDWLRLLNPGMDLTFSIGNVPIRFFTDDADNPKKRGFFKRNDADRLFESEETTPTMHRFVVEKPEFEGEGGRVIFNGYNVFGEIVSTWTYGADRVVMLNSVDDVPPAPVPIELEPISASKTEKEKKQNSK
ncbi:TPA: hypothetical protein LAN07_004889 [Escherichia coli]|uniref:Uncharacterized protein n=1 Tax=Escherichia coli TaxID=562 RepID=A0A7I8ZNX6_ECOLX|nr:hypothetical protein [Escherichia coli]EAB7524842.1 hypothetical protein [Escherichia coli]EEQ2016826.1 hypothetical protein [Escherichia coli]EEQ2331045.1 hypothetical protein [Escherichia coli]EEQ2662216.1 hypothetical protein [Escherichia coli]EEQ2799145.1 hypothetical protein [Escherichia coli]